MTAGGRAVPDQARVEAAYDAVAGEWARAFAHEHDRKPMDRMVLGRFAQEVGTQGEVLDLGCGPGNTAAYLAELGLRVTGLDISENMLEQARRLHPRLPFQKGDLLHLDSPADSWAGIVAFYALIHFTPEQVAAAVQEMFRVLRPGGLVLLAYHVGGQSLHLDEFLGQKIDLDLIFFTSDFIQRGLESCGFEGVEIIERLPYAGIEYQSRRAYGLAKKPKPGGGSK